MSVRSPFPNGHQLTIGQTESGKSIYNKRLAKAYQSHGVRVMVLDPIGDSDEWQETESGHGNIYFAQNPEDFFNVARDPSQSLNCALFVDEGSFSLDKYGENTDWLTCRSRHHGHRAHIISQRAPQISLTTRSQCSTVVLFNICYRDAKIYEEDFNCPGIAKEVSQLPKGHFIRIDRFGGGPIKGRLW